MNQNGRQNQLNSSSKRKKISTFGAYSSSNSNAPTSEYNPTSPTFIRPMGRNATKRKGKEKVGETSSQNESFEVPAAYQERTDAIAKLTRIKEEELTTKELEILFKDTIEISDEQYLVHKWYCQKIKKKYGIS
ncbi:putative glutathione S-transferase [Sesbania bispinosa]|nr:putative glutathione S-transferase [Sesbania bispinosa]